MLKFELSSKLQKKVKIIAKKDKVLAKIFKKKLVEIINRNLVSINTYKNLKSPLNDYKQIHLTDNYILLFKLDKDVILFIDILHWDKAYKSI